jgi:hypothetical protein
VFRRFVKWPANWRVACERFVSGTEQLVLARLFAPIVSGVREPVPGAGIGIDTSRAHQLVRPSIACYRDHSTGASRNRVTPMPRGRRPSMAAFTRTGARKASDIVMLTAKGDPLEAIDRLVPWESFRAEIEAVVLTPVAQEEQRRPEAG